MKTITCSRCHQSGHNVRGCKNPRVRKLAPVVSGEDLERDSGVGMTEPVKVVKTPAKKVATKAKSNPVRVVSQPRPVSAEGSSTHSLAIGEHEIVLQLRLRVQLEVG